MDLKSTYNKIAKDWFRDHNDDDWWIEGTNKFLYILPHDATILDIGCGAGIKSKYLSDKGFKVNGMDFSEGMIEIAKKEFPEIDFRVGDIYNLDSLQSKFDAVFAQAVLLHIPRDKVPEVIKKLKNKLNPGGILYIAVKEVKIGQAQSEILKENDYGYEYERFFSYFTLPEIKEYIQGIEMEVIWENITKAGKTNWVQVIAKNSNSK